MSLAMYLTIQPDEAAYEIKWVPEGHTLDALQQAVGGYVDCIDLHHPATGAIASMWFNDEGKINRLPRNVIADAIANVGGWGGLGWGDWIAGAVAFTGFDPETGETTTLPEEWAHLIDRLVTRIAEALRGQD